jgi:hypothetical protein
MKRQAYILFFLMLLNYIMVGIDIYTQSLFVIVVGGTVNFLVGSFILYVIIKTRRVLMER